MKNGKCPAGKYYCYTDEVCKDIPKGFMVDPEGMLRKENGASVSEDISGVKYSKFTHKTQHLKGKQHQLDPNVDLKQLVHHSMTQYVDRDADGDVDIYDKPSKKTPDENPADINVATASKKLLAKQKGELKHTRRGMAYEENKSGDSSLHDWFSKSKSSDGKPGWVQLGGKYAGKPCAKQPGQTTKPKCGSSKMKRSLDKGEEEAAFRRKNLQDPNPNRSGKAINVKTEAKDHEYSMARSEISTIMNAAKRLQKKMAKGEGEVEAWVQSKITKAADYLDSAADYVDSGEMNKEEFVQEGGLARAMSKSKTQTTGHISADRGSDEKTNRTKRKGLEKDLKKHGIGYKKGVGEYKYGSGETGREVSYHTSPGKGMSKRRFGKVMRRLGRKHDQESVITKDKDKPAKLHYTEKGSKAKSDTIGKTKTGKHPEGYGETSSTKVRSGKLPAKTKNRSFHYEEKDACYHKVKSRYKVWPSAYASGALVKCRKVGADSWGNKTKKEGFTPSQIAALESIGAIEINEAGKKCWKGYKKVGTQKLFGKTYNRCEKEGYSHEDSSGQTDFSYVSEAVTLPRENGQVMNVMLVFRGKFYMMQLFFPTLHVPTKQEVTAAVQKIYPDARVSQYHKSTIDPTQPLLRVAEQTEQNDSEEKQAQQIARRQLMLNRQKIQLQAKAVQKKKGTDMMMQTEVAAWQRKEGKNQSGGLNEKGRKSYERENPGSDLKAPSKKVGNKRRASFCARMSGMKKKLTSAKTANDPNSRINKSLRAWNC